MAKKGAPKEKGLKVVPEAGKEETTAVTPDEFGFTRIPVEDIEPWELNPNEEDSDTFNLLLEEIKEDNERPDDMDQPLIVIPHPDPEKRKHGKYVVMSGNHRHKAVKLAGAETVICRVKDWDEKTAIEKAMRRNTVTGKLSEAKFTKLVNYYSRKHKVDVTDIARELGMKEKEFWNNYKKPRDQNIKKVEDQAKKQAKQELAKLENLSFILNKLFREFGDTLDYQFMFFTYGEKLHLMVHMDSELNEMMTKVSDAASENGVDINAVLKAMIGPGLDALEGILVNLKKGGE